MGDSEEKRCNRLSILNLSIFCLGLFCGGKKLEHRGLGRIDAFSRRRVRRRRRRRRRRVRRRRRRRRRRRMEGWQVLGQPNTSCINV